MLQNKIVIRCADGRLLKGITSGYQPDRAGFFINPADPKSNIERCFVVTRATSEVKLI